MGGDKPRPYEKSGRVGVGAAFMAARWYQAACAARVDEGIDPYRVHLKFPPHL